MPDFQSSAQLTPEIPGTSIDPATSTVADLTQVTAPRPAVITVPPDAAEQAAASDAAWRSGRPRGALEGIPVLVKDNVQVAGAPTTAGSPALLGGQPPDAFVVSRLRAAGARIPGKANPAEGGGLCS